MALLQSDASAKRFYRWRPLGSAVVALLVVLPGVLLTGAVTWLLVPAGALVGVPLARLELDPKREKTASGSGSWLTGRGIPRRAAGHGCRLRRWRCSC